MPLQRPSSLQVARHSAAQSAAEQENGRRMQVDPELEAVVDALVELLVLVVEEVLVVVVEEALVVVLPSLDDVAPPAPPMPAPPMPAPLDVVLVADVAAAPP